MIKELFFPSECVFCKKLANNFACKDCAKSKLSLNCRICKKVKVIEYLIYFVDFKGSYKQMIYRGKYKFDKLIWQLIALNMRQKIDFNSDSFVSFVPISWFRYCFRGFNQANLIANGLDMPVISLLKRYGGSVSIVKNNKQDRYLLMQKTLNLNKSMDLSSYKYCYLVDDVFTSGATMQTAAELIKAEYPHLKVIGLCFAKTPLNS